MNWLDFRASQDYFAQPLSQNGLSDQAIQLLRFDPLLRLPGTSHKQQVNRSMVGLDVGSCIQKCCELGPNLDRELDEGGLHPGFAHADTAGHAGASMRRSPKRTMHHDGWGSTKNTTLTPPHVDARSDRAHTPLKRSSKGGYSRKAGAAATNAADGLHDPGMISTQRLCDELSFISYKVLPQIAAAAASRGLQQHAAQSKSKTPSMTLKDFRKTLQLQNKNKNKKKATKKKRKKKTASSTTAAATPAKTTPAPTPAPTVTPAATAATANTRVFLAPSNASKPQKTRSPSKVVRKTPTPSLKDRRAHTPIPAPLRALVPSVVLKEARKHRATANDAGLITKAANSPRAAKSATPTAAKDDPSDARSGAEIVPARRQLFAHSNNHDDMTSGFVTRSDDDVDGTEVNFGSPGRASWFFQNQARKSFASIDSAIPLPSGSAAGSLELSHSCSEAIVGSPLLAAMSKGIPLVNQTLWTPQGITRKGDYAGVGLGVSCGNGGGSNSDSDNNNNINGALSTHIPTATSDNSAACAPIEPATSTPTSAVRATTSITDIDSYLKSGWMLQHKPTQTASSTTTNTAAGAGAGALPLELAFAEMDVGDTGVAEIVNRINNPLAAPVAVLRLSGNDIGDSGARVLASMLRGNTTVRTLDLSGNEIHAAGAAALGGALATNATLQSLSLRDNAIGDAGMSALCGGLQHNTALSHLGLRGTVLGTVGGKSLVKLLQTNTTLTTVNLQTKAGVAQVDARTIETVLQSNQVKRFKSSALVAVPSGGISVGIGV